MHNLSILTGENTRLFTLSFSGRLQPEQPPDQLREAARQRLHDQPRRRRRQRPLPGFSCPDSYGRKLERILGRIRNTLFSLFLRNLQMEQHI